MINVLDIVFLVPLLWFAYRGFQKGFIIELSSLVALILGIYMAINFSYFAAGLLTDNFEIGDNYLNIIAFIITFVAVIFGVFVVGKILEKIINIILLGFINKLAGGVFGIIKAAFLISVVLWIVNSLDPGQNIIKEKSKQESYLYEHVESFAPTIIPKLNLDQIRNIDLPDPEEIINSI
jgi:membrane protein required for colicin V production